MIKAGPMLSLSLLVTAGFLATYAPADPCGMVPPIVLNDPNAPGIARTGEQQTYVFYKDGIETFAIRPAYEGSVDDFGMLIPMPAVPSLRKISDDTFMHLRKAIDPPEVTVWAGDWRRMDAAESLGRGGAGAPRPTNDADGVRYRKNKVSVRKKEAVGMYEVVVLEAGSAEALNKWMTKHGYKYPEGMDKVCEEYIAQNWLFTAVKTKIGQKDGINPGPGMEDVNPDRPKNSVFDGYVQGMAFRFESPELVVPMRLSAYNEGDTHNIVYVLTDHASAIKNIPTDFVRRQISGEELYVNLTQPAPLRVQGGTIDQVPEYELNRVASQRNPRKHNGQARDLFAADLLAARIQATSHEFEDREKALLNISEALDIRGKEIDVMHAQAVAKDRSRDFDAALVDLLDMTLTVIDGDFQREVIARENLNFINYDLPAAKNQPTVYHAVTRKARAEPSGKFWRDEERNKAVLGVASMLKDMPLSERRDTIAKVEAKGESIHNPLAKTIKEKNEDTPWFVWVLGGLAICGALAGGYLLGRKRGVGSAMLVGTLTLLAVHARSANASEAAPEKEKISSELQLLLDQLGTAETGDDAATQLAQRKGAYEPVLATAFGGEDLIQQGWAIVAMRRMDNDRVDMGLMVLHDDDRANMLVRTWAAGARIARAKSADDLAKLSPEVKRFPALGRSYVKRLVEGSDAKNLEALIAMAQTLPHLANELNTAIAAYGEVELIKVMQTAKSDTTRYRATQVLGGLAAGTDNTVAESMIAAYAANPDAKTYPWKGGALYLPNVAYTKEQAQDLLGNLIGWGLWLESTKPDGYKQQLQQIYNNLYSVGLLNRAGMGRPRSVSAKGWFELWKSAAGESKSNALLKAWKMGGNPEKEEDFD